MAALTLRNTDNETVGQRISAAYREVEVQALRDKREKPADDLRGVAGPVHALRAALVAVGIVKGGA